MRLTVPLPTPIVPLVINFDRLLALIVEGAQGVAAERYQAWRSGSFNRNESMVDPDFTPDSDTSHSLSGAESLADWYDFDFDSISESNIIGPH